MEIVNKVNNTVSKLTFVVSCFFLFLMAAHITLDVVTRYFFVKGVPGTLETVSFYYMVFVVFLPLAYVETRNENITVDVFVQRLPRLVQLYIYIFACFVGFVYFGILFYQSFLDAVRSTQSLETAMANFKFYLWPSRWALPIGFLAMCLAILNNFFKAIKLKKPL